ncbi:MAG: carbamoyltransferase [Proteobacteria bacterium]|nr:carbamoyltransferase [Pseudomonadota bacterium]
MIVLGIHTGSGHDSAAAILVDGRLVASVEEERLTRRKHDGAFPHKAIDFCLSAAGVRADEVDHVAHGWHPYAALARRLGFLARGLPGRGALRRAWFVATLTRVSLSAERALRRRFPRARLHRVEHHLAHAASAFFCSPFERAAIISYDGRGEWATGLVARGEGNRIARLRERHYPNSLGLLYTAVTHFLGFESNDEYKVMGLSSYGEPEFLDLFARILGLDREGFYRVDTSWLSHPGYAPVPWGRNYFSARMVERFGPPRASGEPVRTVHKNLAKSLQRAIEDLGVGMASRLRAETGLADLGLAGGVALNGLMNHRIKTEAGFDRLFIPPAASDGGVALGAALWVQHQVLGAPRRFVLEHAYWGPSFADEAIAAEIDAYRLPSRRLPSPERTAAGLIAGNRIIGWFQGRSELGPRALGNRSILADPRDKANKDNVNARIKFREEFRPFAPSVLEERAAEFFPAIGASPYMLQICPVAAAKKALIPAVVHVDGTARPQTVSRATNPRYYGLIERFAEVTGVPVVLNTSFNVKGEPIVDSPADAIRCFYSTGLDYLILGRRLVGKGDLAPGVD